MFYKVTNKVLKEKLPLYHSSQIQPMSMLQFDVESLQGVWHTIMLSVLELLTIP